MANAFRQSTFKKKLCVSREHITTHPLDLQASSSALRTASMMESDNKRGAARRKFNKKPAKVRALKNQVVNVRPLDPLTTSYYGETKHSIPEPVTHRLQDYFCSTADALKLGLAFCYPITNCRAMPSTVEVMLDEHPHIEQLANDFQYISSCLQEWIKYEFNKSGKSKIDFNIIVSRFCKCRNDSKTDEARIIARLMKRLDEFQQLKSCMPKQMLNVIVPSTAIQCWNDKLTTFVKSINSDKVTWLTNVPYLNDEGVRKVDEIIDDIVNGDLTCVKELQITVGKLATGNKSKRANRSMWQDSPDDVEVIQGMIVRQKEGCLLFDTYENQLVLALPVQSKNTEVPFIIPVGGDWERYKYTNGDYISPNDQKMSINSKCGRRCLLLKLNTDHGFSRYWHKHVDNSDFDAPIHKRVSIKSFQVFFVRDNRRKEGELRLFIRPIATYMNPTKKFYDTVEGKYVFNRKTKKLSKFVVGVDRGTNVDFTGGVVDFTGETPVVALVHKAQSRKDEYLVIKNKIACAQSDLTRTRLQSSPRVVLKSELELKALFKKLREFKLLSVESEVAVFEKKLSNRFGIKNYVWGLEFLSDGITSNRSAVDKKFKSVAAYKRVVESVVSTAVKNGINNKATEKIHYADNVVYVHPAYTSQVGISGVLFNKTKKANHLYEGRQVGKHISREECDGVFQLANDSGRNWGVQLFWDTEVEVVNGRKLTHGIIYHCDVMASVMIALKTRAVQEGLKGQDATLRMCELAKQLTFAKNCGIEWFEPIMSQSGELIGMKRLAV
jgi:hypothetical protein